MSIEGHEFYPMDKVYKATGDYKFVGTVVAVFRKIQGGLIRYVVENDDGVLHIFSEKDLKKIVLTPEQLAETRDEHQEEHPGA